MALGQALNPFQNAQQQQVQNMLQDYQTPRGFEPGRGGIATGGAIGSSPSAGAPAVYGPASGASQQMLQPADPQMLANLGIMPGTQEYEYFSRMPAEIAAYFVMMTGQVGAAQQYAEQILMPFIARAQMSGEDPRTGIFRGIVEKAYGEALGPYQGVPQEVVNSFMNQTMSELAPLYAAEQERVRGLATQGGLAPRYLQRQTEVELPGQLAQQRGQAMRQFLLQNYATYQQQQPQVMAGAGAYGMGMAGTESRERLGEYQVGGGLAGQMAEVPVVEPPGIKLLGKVKSPTAPGMPGTAPLPVLPGSNLYGQPQQQQAPLRTGQSGIPGVQGAWERSWAEKYGPPARQPTGVPGMRPLTQGGGYPQARPATMGGGYVGPAAGPKPIGTGPYGTQPGETKKWSTTLGARR